MRTAAPSGGGRSPYVSQLEAVHRAASQQRVFVTIRLGLTAHATARTVPATGAARVVVVRQGVVVGRSEQLARDTDVDGRQLEQGLVVPLHVGTLALTGCDGRPLPVGEYSLVGVAAGVPVTETEPLLVTPADRLDPCDGASGPNQSDQDAVSLSGRAVHVRSGAGAAALDLQLLAQDGVSREVSSVLLVVRRADGQTVSDAALQLAPERPVSVTGGRSSFVVGLGGCGPEAVAPLPDGRYQARVTLELDPASSDDGGYVATDLPLVVGTPPPSTPAAACRARDLEVRVGTDRSSYGRGDLVLTHRTVTNRGTASCSYVVPVFAVVDAAGKDVHDDPCSGEGLTGEGFRPPCAGAPAVVLEATSSRTDGSDWQQRDEPGGPPAPAGRYRVAVRLPDGTLQVDPSPGFTLTGKG